MCPNTRHGAGAVHVPNEPVEGEAAWERSARRCGGESGGRRRRGGQCGGDGGGGGLEEQSEAARVAHRRCDRLLRELDASLFGGWRKKQPDQQLRR